jgi:hypothetical protein
MGHERMDYLRRVCSPMVSKKFPIAIVQSDLWFKSIFRLWLGIEPSEEESRALLEEAREIFIAPT